jgi:hypothetical protein
MHRNSKRRAVAVSVILLSISVPRIQNAFAGDLVSGVIKTGVHAASSIAKTGTSAASSLVQSSNSLHSRQDSAQGSATLHSAIDSRGAKAVGRDYPLLEGAVSSYQPNTVISATVDSLVEAALAKDPRTEYLNAAVEHYNKFQSKLTASAKDNLNFAVPYRGFDPSIEAADIASGENFKIRSLGSAEYARQKQIDELHVKVVSSVMQIAMGLGMQDHAQGQQKVNAELNNLRQLVGDDEANQAAQTLAEWSNNISVPESAFNQQTWDVNQQKDKMLSVMSNALNSDPVVAEIMMRLHKYNHKSKFSRVSARAIETALGTIALGPDFVGAGGRLALGTFVAATGGPEQAKMMKEAYFSKRLESRSNVLNDETHLALQNYQLGALTRNSVLMAAAEAIVRFCRSFLLMTCRIPRAIHKFAALFQN